MDIDKGDQITVKVNHIDAEIGSVGYPIIYDNYSNFNGGDIYVPDSTPGEIYSVKITHGCEFLWVAEIEATLREESDLEEKKVRSGTEFTVEIDSVTDSGDRIAYPSSDDYEDLEIRLATGEPGEKVEAKIDSVHGDWADAHSQARENELREQKREQLREKRRQRKRRELEKRKQRVEKRREEAAEENKAFRKGKSREVLNDALSEEARDDEKQVVETSNRWIERLQETREDLSDYL